MLPAPLLVAEGLRWQTPGGKRLFDGLSLLLSPGDYVWLSGPSGVGKSSLLRLLNRLISPAAGQIIFLGRPLGDWPAPHLRRRLLLVGQAAALTKGSVADNLLLPFGFRAAHELERPTDELLRRALGRVGLNELALDQAVDGLSVGQAQRLCLARALLLRPNVLLLDEPLAPLDPDSQALVDGLVAEFAAQGGAALMVSHQRPEKANRRLRLVDGALEATPWSE
ncbi:ABC transporter related protein [Desulfarculus baarsii DSM 2075]|uniref:ABC transporter related protein n=1 Tax=Desulfarculus baarsii (strain ATCC 33931 / DSM 2075 / LMG 7858 / VKM B-1802 / 2st14) TaxID=644282 RepID=E1QK94_DESB2|nr:ATP-binding cassette domain-containing protein [Desulfarculus baarsii]ADK85987.1 ABC transporter related protein [Desulfarculus baarsii DSM 2075]